VLVEIRDLAAADPPAEAWLADCLDLTPAEARVAVLLFAGLDRRAIARRLGIADNTVRVHLVRLMSKTETHRQAELVQLLGQVAALQRSAPIQ
jgi:DNA-binding CsgD family transcriptional regulator